MKCTILKTIFLCLCLLSVTCIQAQTLERHLISPYGQLSATNDVHVSATGGELIVSTMSTASVTASQGFQQANIEDFVGIYELSPVEMEVRVFPNPVSTYINVELQSEQSNTVFLALYDVTGKIIYRSPEIPVNLHVKRTIEFDKYPDGQYFLIVTDEENKLLQSFKVQKH